MCDQHLAGGPLVCTRTDAHDAPRGCSYVSTSGVPNHNEPKDDE